MSDRLNKAKTQRLIAAGVLSSEHALKPEPAPESVLIDEDNDDLGTFAPITIEVAPTGLHPVNEVRNLGEVEAGATCPNCNGPAHLDIVDLVGQTNHFTCATCGTMWQTSLSSSENLTR